MNDDDITDNVPLCACAE